jgi:TetR/AcrR family transcriptional regulator
MPGPTPTPKHILKAATRLFAARGVDGVSVQEVAAAVGVTKPSLLYHFSTKDDLRRAVLEEVLLRWNDVLPRLLRAATSGQGQFEAVVGETLAFFAADPDRARLLLREILDRPEVLAGLIALHVRPWAMVVCDYIRRGQEQGRVHADVDPEAYVAVVTSVILATVATARCLRGVLPPDVSDEAALAQLTAEVLRLTRASLFRPRPA